MASAKIVFEEALKDRFFSFEKSRYIHLHIISLFKDLCKLFVFLKTTIGNNVVINFPVSSANFDRILYVLGKYNLDVK